MSTQLSHKSFIDRAKKIHVDMFNIYNETIESIDKLKTESPADQLYLLREANVYADDLNKAIYELTRVTFKIDKSKHIHRKLEHVINTLCDLTAGIHRSFHFDHDKVKNELKHSIKSATHIAEQLLYIISFDDAIEHREEILNSQADILFAADRLRLCNLTQYLNPTELGDVMHKPVDTIKATLLSLDPKEPNITQKIIQYSNHSIYKHQHCVDHIQKAATSHHFNDKIKTLFLDIATIIHRFVVDMTQIFLKDSQFDTLIADCHKLIVEGVAGIVKLLSLLDDKENLKDSESARELILYCYGYSVACVFQFMRSLQYVKSSE